MVQFAHSIHQLLWERARGNEILSINQALRTVFVHCWQGIKRKNRDTKLIAILSRQYHIILRRWEKIYSSYTEYIFSQLAAI